MILNSNKSMRKELLTHTNDTTNPHNVTPEIIGADPVGSANNALTSANEYTNQKTKRFSNPNLLDNWYFMDPIYQRDGHIVPPGVDYFNPGESVPTGVTENYINVDGFEDGVAFITIGSKRYAVDNTIEDNVIRGYIGSGYGIDRWRSNASGIILKLIKDGIVISTHYDEITDHYPQLRQYLNDPQKFRQKQLTFSVLTGEISSKSWTIFIRWEDETGKYIGESDHGQLTSNSLSFVTVTIPEDIHNFQIAFRCKLVTATNDDYITIKAAKLELGTEQTLAHQDENGNWVLNDPPPSKELELLKCIQSKADSTDEYANKVIATGYNSNPNLLDNWYFMDPIDQRGGYIAPTGTPWWSTSALSGDPGGVALGPRKIVELTSMYARWVYDVDGASYYCKPDAVVRGYVGAGYTIDRWKSNSTKIVIELVDNGIKFSSSATSGVPQLAQILENVPSFIGKTITFSVLTADVLGDSISMYIRFAKSNGSYISGAEYMQKLVENSLVSTTVVVPDGVENIQICLRQDVTETSVNDYAVVVAAKLELGSNQTLAHQDENGNWVLNDPPPNKALELAKCQRYQIEVLDKTIAGQSHLCVVRAISETRADGTLFLPITMRDGGLPSLITDCSEDSPYGASGVFSSGYSDGDGVITKIEVYTKMNHGVVLKTTGTNFVKGNFYQIYLRETKPHHFLLDRNL